MVLVFPLVIRQARDKPTLTSEVKSKYRKLFPLLSVSPKRNFKGSMTVPKVHRASIFTVTSVNSALVNLK